jgi:hypothetical protein
MSIKTNELKKRKNMKKKDCILFYMFLIKRKTIGSPGINWNGSNAKRQMSL